MANQYDSTTDDVRNNLSNAHGEQVADAVQQLLGNNDDVQVESATTAEEAQGSGADVLFLNLAEGESGSITAPLHFDDSDFGPPGSGTDTITGGSGTDTGRVYIFEGSKGVHAEFNTIDRVIVGTSGDDGFTVNGDKNTTVEGGVGNDTITSSGGDDSIAGGVGNDSVTAGTGNDSVYGGTGEDTTAFSGNQSDYSIVQDGAITIVTNKATGDVTQVVNAEALSFADGDVAVELSSDVKALVTLYKQIFSNSADRQAVEGLTEFDGQADLEGLQYWVGRVESGLTLGAAATRMLDSDENGNKLRDLDMSSAADRETAVELLYTGILGREADAEGLDYWADQLENGASLDRVADQFVHSEELGEQTFAENNWDFIL